MGTVNLITQAKVKQAIGLTREGVRVSLAHTVLTEKSEDNPSPLAHVMIASGENLARGRYALDSYSVAYHGYAHTHMDALSHAFYEGKMYNGFAQSEVTGEGDAWEKKAGIKIGGGDVVFVRTGRWARRAAKGPWAVSEQTADYTPRALRG